MVAELFMKLVRYDTQSDSKSETYPSTSKQVDFANVLAEECKAIGLTEVSVDKHGYMTATLPGNLPAGKTAPTIGFFAHMDTSPDASGKNVNPRVVKSYDGGDIALNDRISLTPAEFPSLKSYVGQDLIVTDGNTLLGGDDKAGIAAILSAMAKLIADPSIPHGKIRVAFTPDEEIGRGVDFFDASGFGCDFAYTLDGGEIGEIVTESFNASEAKFIVTGKSVHPGTAKGVMINAALIAGEIISAFPSSGETPATTENYEGFYHLNNVTGGVESAELIYILRDHDPDILKRREAFAAELAQKLNEKYGEGTVAIEITQQYRNMDEILKEQPHVTQIAKDAIIEAGITPVVQPIRGGTDGSRLTFMGLPCPNIFAGYHNAHGPYEYVPIPSLEAAVRVVVNIAKAVVR
jgi:tripeptide aminopeptidase